MPPRTSAAFVLLLMFAAGAPSASTLRAQQVPGPELVSRNQVALEVGIISVGLSYARRVGGGPLSIGAGLWGAWEPAHTFDRTVWEPVGFVVFARYSRPPWLQVDLGPGLLTYVWADDCSECSGTFVGVRFAARLGYRFVFLGPEVWVGSASDRPNGAEFGAMVGAQLRFVVGWGR